MGVGLRSVGAHRHYLRLSVLFSFVWHVVLVMPNTLDIFKRDQRSTFYAKRYLSDGNLLEANIEVLVSLGMHTEQE